MLSTREGHTPKFLAARCLHYLCAWILRYLHMCTDTHATYTWLLPVQLVETDPLKLFSLEGTDRADCVYSVNNGKLYLMLYVLEPHLGRPVT